MLYAVDIIRQGDEHRSVNHPTLKALLDTDQLKRVWLANNSTAKGIIQNREGVKLYSVSSNGNKMYRWIISTLITIQILYISIRESADIFFMSATPLHYFLITGISFFFKRKNRVIIVMHGELAYLNSSDGIGQFLGALMLRIAFRFSKYGHIKYISLGFPIYKQLNKRFPYLKNNLLDFEHPLINKRELIEASKSDGLIHIGSFGVHNKDKNSEKIYELANKIYPEYLESIELSTIGISRQDFMYFKSKFVNHYCTEGLGESLVPTDVFMSCVLTLDWALMFQGDSIKYDLIASGVFFDCINNEIPIIALRSYSLESYFKKYGELGVLCDSIDDMAIQISKIAKGEITVLKFKSNIKNVKKVASYANYRMKLHELLA